MKKLTQTVAILMCLIGLVVTHVTPAHALNVSNIRIGQFENKTRFVIDLSEHADYRIFHLDTPERVVIDLPSFKWKTDTKKGDPTDVIKSYRHGQFNKKTSRLVLDLNSTAVVDSAFILPPDNNKPYRLVVDLKKSSHAAFTGSLKKIIGSETDPVKKVNNIKKAKITLDAPKKKQKPVVVIDAGHGGRDPGAVKNGILEKNITLLAAKNLRNALNKTGNYRVILTRDRDIFHKLRRRYQIARENNADLFISLHADSLTRPHVSGASVYTLSETASDKETAKLAERENKSDAIAGFDLTHEDADVADILIDLTVRDTMNHSKIFADTLVSAFQSNRIKTLERPHRYAGFAVLKAPDIPSVLVELGFLSNSNEAKKLNTSAHRTKLSNAMVDAIDNYFADGVNKAVF